MLLADGTGSGEFFPVTTNSPAGLFGGVSRARAGQPVTKQTMKPSSCLWVGARPGAAVKQTMQVTGTVTKIDGKRRTVTLRFSDGSSGRFAVRDDIDLAKHKVGEKVVIRVKEAFAVKMEKP